MGSGESIPTVGVGTCRAPGPPLESPPLSTDQLASHGDQPPQVAQGHPGLVPESWATRTDGHFHLFTSTQVSSRRSPPRNLRPSQDAPGARSPAQTGSAPSCHQAPPVLPGPPPLITSLLCPPRLLPGRSPRTQLPNPQQFASPHSLCLSAHPTGDTPTSTWPSSHISGPLRGPGPQSGQSLELRRQPPLLTLHIPMSLTRPLPYTPLPKSTSPALASLWGSGRPHPAASWTSPHRCPMFTLHPPV